MQGCSYCCVGVLYESEITFSPKIFPYNADVIAVWANEIGPLQISNRYNCRLVVEIDGDSHDYKREYDKERDDYLAGLGLTVIHISVYGVMRRIELVMESLSEFPALLNGYI